MFFLQMTCLAGQSNLVANSNVETGSPASWNTCIGGGASATLTWATDRYVSSSHSLKIVMSNSIGCADWRQYFSGIDTTATYRLRAHIYASNVASGSHSVEIQWFNGGTYLSTSSIASTTANSWKEVKLLNITPPSNATAAYVLLRSYAAGTYYFDDIVFMREDKDLVTLGGQFPFGLYTLPETQVLANPDMEYLTGQAFYKGNGMGPSGWNTHLDFGTATHVWDDANYSSGARSVKIIVTAAGQADWRQKVIGIKPGDNYILDAKIYASNVSQGSHDVEVQWFNASGSYLSSNTASSSSANTWASVTTGSVTAAAGTSYAWILCRTYSVGTYNFDMVKLTKDLGFASRLNDAYNAGFNFLGSYDPSYIVDMSNSGVNLKAAYELDLVWYSTLEATVTAMYANSAIAIWMGPDESAWRGLNSNDVAGGCGQVKNNDDYFNTAPHLRWLNMAPRGTPSAPADFTTLKPFCTNAEAVSVDIYPVPEGNGHSNLVDQTISCVGKYVDTLYSNVVSDGGTQRRAIWMVLQGGWFWGVSNAIELQWFGSDDGLIRVDSYQAPETGTWQLISDSNVRPPSGATRVWVLARTYYNGTYYFDDISLSTGGNNLLSNSNMETVGGSWTTGSDGRGSPTQTWDTATYYSSNHSLKTVMYGCSYVDWRQQVTGINPANTYSLSARINVSSLSMPLPTWTQTRFMAYNAVIHGARGLAYYEPAIATIDSGAWSDMKSIAAEIHSLSNVLTSYKSFRTVTASNNNIETLLMEYNGNLYLLAANTSSSSTGNVTFTISGLPVSSSTEFFESRQLTVSSNQFTENTAFSGYQVHVYNIH